MMDRLRTASSLLKMLFLLLVHGDFTRVLAFEQVHFAKYGHCTKADPFDLGQDTYQVLSKGVGIQHQTSDCSLSFKAAPGHGVCVSFESFLMDECHTRLLVYKSKDGDGDVWKEFTCESERPSQLCTSERYVTLRVRRKQLTGYKNYKFKIKIEQSSSVTDEGVVFASIGFVIGIICAVFVFLVIIALVVYCCCLRKKREGDAPDKKHDFITNNRATQPSAPPLMEGDHAIPLYPRLQPQQDTPMLEPRSPPAYDEPPPYTPQQT